MLELKNMELINNYRIINIPIWQIAFFAVLWFFEIRRLVKKLQNINQSYGNGNKAHQTGMKFGSWLIFLQIIGFSLLVLFGSTVGKYLLVISLLITGYSAAKDFYIGFLEGINNKSKTGKYGKIKNVKFIPVFILLLIKTFPLAVLIFLM